MKSSNEAMMEWSTYVARARHTAILAGFGCDFRSFIDFCKRTRCKSQTLKST